MAHGQAGSILRHIRTILDTQATRSLSDSQLLERFVARRDESAFGALRQRHGRLAWSVCRNILHREQDAEDAFQATFLVLARRAASIRKGESVGSWLYGVAHRVAMKAKKTAAKRVRYERSALPKPPENASQELGLRELQAILHEELQRLPEKYRTPFVLCCLEGRSRKEVAQELGWKEGTVSSRIAQARLQLQRRLTRRGVALSAVLCAAAVIPNAASAALVSKTIREVMLDAVGQGKVISAKVAALADGAVKAMAVGKAKVGMALVLAVSLVGAGVRLSANQIFRAEPQAAEKIGSEKPPAENGDIGPEVDKKPLRVDLHGDPLPPGAIARLGTNRLRHHTIYASIPGAFSPDGKVLTTEGWTSLRMWDTPTGKLLREITDDQSVFWYTTGRFLATYGHDEKSVNLRDPNTGQILKRIHTGRKPLAFSHNDKLLVTGWSPDGSLDVWETATGKHLVSLKGAERPIPGAFTLDDKTLVTLDLATKKICRWEVATGTLQKSLDTRVDWRTLQFSPDGQTMAVVPYSREAVSLWDTETGKEKFKLQGDPAYASGLAFSPDGKTLATNCWAAEGTLSLWDAETGKPIRRFQAPARAISHLQFAPDGRTLLSSGDGPHVHLWDTVTGKELLVTEAHEGTINSLAFTPDGERLVSCADYTVRLWEISTGRQLRVVARDPHGLSCMALTPDGRAALSGGYMRLGLNELATGKESRSLLLDEHPEKLPKLNGVNPAHWTYRLGVSADGRRAASLSSAGRQLKPFVFGSIHEIHVWDLATSKLLARRDMGNGVGVIFLGFSPGMRTLASSILPPQVEVKEAGASQPSDRLIAIQDTLTGRGLVSLSLPDGFGYVCAFSPDERMFVTTTNVVRNTDKGAEFGLDTLRFWELATGKERQVIRSTAAGQEHEFAQIAFGSNGRILATARRNGSLQLWDAVTGKELFHGTGSDSDVTAMALSPDGKLLVTGHQDSTILVWDISSAKQPDGLGDGQPGKKELERWWSDLAGADAAKAYTAIWCLAAASSQAVPMLRDRLQPAKPVPADEVKRLIAELDNNQFQRREAAAQRLAKLGQQIEPELQAALKARLPLGQRRRIEQLLEAPRVIRSPEELQSVRAVEALEHIATPEAREILQTLANGPPAARLTAEAQAALERLAPRTARRP
jgi:RNA polymerase sigma factor (sigma-70 family)